MARSAGGGARQPADRRALLPATRPTPSTPQVYAFSRCGFCHPDLITVVETAAGTLLKEAAADRGYVRGLRRAWPLLSWLSDGGTSMLALARPACGAACTLARGTAATQSPPRSFFYNPAQAIANILDAYSRVGCSSPDVVDQLVARVRPVLESSGRPGCVQSSRTGQRGRRAGGLRRRAHPLANAAPTRPRRPPRRRPRTPAPLTPPAWPRSPPPSSSWGAPSQPAVLGCLACLVTAAVVELGCAASGRCRRCCRTSRGLDACAFRSTTPCRYSDEDVLLPLLDTSAAKLSDFSPRAVVELVRPCWVPGLPGGLGG